MTLPQVAGPRSTPEPVTDMTIVCCIESGPLEHQTARLVESLRRWGGTFARAPVLAVTPRVGPPLLRSTHDTLEKHGVEHLRVRGRTRYLWQHYMNKPLAIAAAAERVSTPLLAWFDSDIVIVDPPDELVMGAEEDFLACARDRGIGSTGPGDPNESYWSHVCGVAGIGLESMPWVRTEQEGERIRLYWNSGLFAFRVDSDFAEDYLQLNIDLLDSKVGSAKTRLQYNDQVALGLSMIRTGLRWRPLSHSHNYGVSRWHPLVREELATARVIHYHDSLAPDFFPELVGRIEATHPQAGSWLRSLGPLPRPPAVQSALRQSLRAARSLRRHTFYRQCRWI